MPGGVSSSQKVMNGGGVKGTEGDEMDEGETGVCLVGGNGRARDSKRETTRDCRWRDHTKKSQRDRQLKQVMCRAVVDLAWVAVLPWL